MTDEERSYWDAALKEFDAKLDAILARFADRPKDTLSQRITKLEEALRRPGAP